jgi:transcription initiation factor IIF auxiliary subunit
VGHESFFLQKKWKISQIPKPLILNTRLTKPPLTVKKTPPFRIEEDGWGEFEVEITMTDVSGKEHQIKHDLNFGQERYDSKQVITFKNPKGELAVALRASGPVPGDAGGDLVNGKKGGRASGIGGADGELGKKRKKTDTRGIDMDSLAEKLQKLGEDDLLQVVQMVHDNKSEDSWMRNDVDRKCIPRIHLPAFN